MESEIEISLRVLSFSLHSSFSSLSISLGLFALCTRTHSSDPPILQCCCFLQSTRLHFKSISGKQIRLQSRYINFWPTDFEGSYMLQKFNNTDGWKRPTSDVFLSVQFKHVVFNVSVSEYYIVSARRKCKHIVVFNQLLQR